MNKFPIKAFKSVKETTSPEVSQMIGNVPEWVTGKILSTNPAKWDYPNFHLTHFFDGYIMICKFEIRGGTSGTVSFSSRFLQSEAFQKAEQAQKCIKPEYSTRSAGSDMSKSVFSRLMSSVIPETTDNCQFICTSDLCNNPLVLGDTGIMYELDTESLECISKHDPVKEFSLHCISAHPMTDKETGDTYNIGISLSGGLAKWKILKFPPGCNSRPLKDSIKTGKIVATHPCRNKMMSIPWFHSFGMTPNYLIFIDQPSYFNVAKAVASPFKGLCPREINEWKPEMKCRFYYYDKRSCKFVDTEILSKDAFFYYHVLNCYEENDHLIVDVFGMANFKLVDTQVMSRIRAGERVKDQDSPYLYRYCIPLAVGNLKNCSENKNLVTIQTTATATRIDNKIILVPELLHSSPMEYPTCNKKFSGQSLRYIWVTGAYSPSYQQHKITKFDLHSRKTLQWAVEESMHLSEPQFVPNPIGTSQDDGVLVIVAINYVQTKRGKDFMAFLDAKTLLEIGRCYFNADIPVALHNVWVSDN